MALSKEGGGEWSIKSVVVEVVQSVRGNSI